METDYEVRYNVVFSPDTTNLAHKVTEKMFLYTGSDFGYFWNTDVLKMEKDLEDARKRHGNSPYVTFDFSEESQDIHFEKQIFKFLSDQKIVSADKISGKRYSYHEPDMPMDWKIEDSVKTYLDYTVQKASTRFAGRVYTAWFSFEIPIPDGPYVFFGLPGLIVELYDAEDQYHFSLESIQKLDKTKEWKIPEDAKEIEKSEYLQMQKRIRKNAENANKPMQMIEFYRGDIDVSIYMWKEDGEEKIEMNYSHSDQKISERDFIKAYRHYLKTHTNSIELN